MTGSRLLALVLMALGAPAPSAEAQAGLPPAEIGLSAEGRLQAVTPRPMESRLQAALDSARAAVAAPGMTAAVILPDGDTWSGASGIASPGEPAAPGTPFELGSVTKTYTGALALLLAGEGRLALDDPLARWHPELPGAETITVAQLLNHTHGLHDPLQDEDFVPAVLQNPTRAWTLDDVLSRMGEPAFPPGEGWAYSNTGYHLLGSVLEQVTGGAFGDLLHERILEPLELRETWYAGGGSLDAPVAAAFIDVNWDGSPVPVSLMMPWTAFRTSAGPAGALVASAPDAARWLHALVTGSVLQPAERERMEAWVDRPDGNRHGLGLLRLERDDGPLVGHMGNSAGYSASVFHDLGSGITVAVLSNAHATDVTPAVIALLEVARAGGASEAGNRGAGAEEAPEALP